MKRFLRIRLAVLAWLTVVLFAGVSFAAQVVGAADPNAVPADPTAILGQILQQLMDAAKAGKWVLVVPLAILLVVAGLRWVGGKVAGPETGFGKFLANKWTRWAMNFATTFCGALVTAASTGTAITPSLVVASIVMSLTAAGTLELARDVVDSLTAKKAQDAGKAAAANPGPTLNG